MKRLFGVAALLLCGPVWAASATLSWTPPEFNTDGSAYTDPGGYVLYAGCNQSGTYELVPATINDPAVTSYVYEGLPNGATCFFAATAVNASGVESVYSNEATKVLPALEEPIPGPVENLRVEWSEGVVVPTDNFNRTDASTLGANWTTQTSQSDLGIEANAVDSTDIFGVAGAIYTASSPTDGDHFSQATAVTISSRTQSVRVRAQSDAETYYAAGKQNFELGNGGTYTIWKVVAGTHTEIAVHGSQQIANDDVVRLEAEGTTLTLFVNDTQILQDTDSDISGGSWGLGIFDSETDAARWDDWEGGDVGAGGGGTTVQLGLVSETNTAQAFGRAKARSIGLNTETDLAQAFGRAKSLGIGLNVETDAAQAFGRAKNRAIGLLNESDQVFAMGTGGNVAIGLIAEQDAVQAFGRLKGKAIGLLSESDLAQGFNPVKSRVLGLPSETDTLFSLSSAKKRVLGIVSESDVALVMSAVRARELGLISETDFVFGLSSIKSKSLSLISETDLALAMTPTGPAIVVVTNVVAHDARFQVALKRNVLFAEIVTRDVKF